MLLLFYISQVVLYFMDYVQSFSGQSSATDMRLLKQDYVASRLTSSLQEVFRGHHELIER